MAIAKLSAGHHTIEVIGQIICVNGQSMSVQQFQGLTGEVSMGGKTTYPLQREQMMKVFWAGEMIEKGTPF